MRRRRSSSRVFRRRSRWLRETCRQGRWEAAWSRHRMERGSKPYAIRVSIRNGHSNRQPVPLVASPNRLSTSGRCRRRESCERGAAQPWREARASPTRPDRNVGPMAADPSHRRLGARAAPEVGVSRPELVADNQAPCTGPESGRWASSDHRRPRLRPSAPTSRHSQLKPPSACTTSCGTRVFAGQSTCSRRRGRALYHFSMSRWYTCFRRSEQLLLSMYHLYQG